MNPRMTSIWEASQTRCWMTQQRTEDRMILIKDLYRNYRNRNIPLRWRHMNAMWHKIPSLSTACLTTYEGPTSKKHQSPRYWPFVRVIHRWPVNSPHKGPVTRKKLPFYDVIMLSAAWTRAITSTANRGLSDNDGWLWFLLAPIISMRTKVTSH